MTHLTDKLIALGETGQRPCSDAVEWCRQYDSLPAAWAVCQRGDWMLWLAGRLAGPKWSLARRPLVRAAAECAMLELPYARDEWVAGIALATCQTAVAWSEGEASDEDVQDASDAAAADADTAATTHAAYAAYAAYAADAAAYAAYVAAYAAAYAAADAAAARDCVLSRCADIVRAIIPCPVLL